MAAEPYTIANPRENNRLLRVTSPCGQRILAVLKPGESFRADQPSLLVTVVPLPARLHVAEDGLVRPDTRRGGPKLAREPR